MSRNADILPVGLGPGFVLGLFLPMASTRPLSARKELPLDPGMHLGVYVNPDPPPSGAILRRLVTQAFAHMEGRVDPPLSSGALGPIDIDREAGDKDLIVARSADRIVGCLFACQTNYRYCLHSIAVDCAMRQKGIARGMVDAAARHAEALGLRELYLESRIELTENHAAFNALGFRQTGTFTHRGYSTPTSLVFTRPLSPAVALS